MTSPVIRNGAVLTRAGRVICLGSRADVIAAARGLGAGDAAGEEIHYEGVITPGLVNAHTHLQYTGISSVGRGTYNGMDDWAVSFNEKYDALAADPDFDEWGLWATEGAKMLIGSGTTAAADVVTDEAASGSLHDSGLRGVCYFEAMNVTGDDWRDGYWDRLMAAVMEIPGPPAAGISPHAPYSVDLVPMQEMAIRARKLGLRRHIHVGEIPIEGELVDPVRVVNEFRMGFHARDFRELRLRGDGISVIKLYDSLGVLGPDCHIAHGIYVDADDRAVLRRNSTVVALCPRSNAVIGLDEAPVRAYLEEGNPIAVGTDSLSSVRSLDLLDETEALVTIARKQGYSGMDLYERIFRAATAGGAQAMGLSADGTGAIETGGVADMACFDVPRVESLSEVELYEIITCGLPETLATMIGGELRYRR